MSIEHRSRCSALTLAVLFAGTPAARASDGVIEINHARALAGSVTPGDTPGYPVTLSASGSYLLTSNLSVPANVSGIRIGAPNVTLDLGGFTVAGPNTCTGYPVTDCTLSNSSAAGIYASEYFTVIRNGIVAGASGYGVFVDDTSGVVEDVRVVSSGGHGIRMGSAARVTRCLSAGNDDSGIVALAGGMLEGNEVRANGGTAIIMQASIVGDPLLSGIATGNRVFQNAGLGIAVDSRTLVTRNVSNLNGFTAILGGVSLGDNLCNGVLC